MFGGGNSTDRIGNSDIRKKNGVVDVIDLIVKKMNLGGTPKKKKSRRMDSAYNTVATKSKQESYGRPQKQWVDDIKSMERRY